MFLDKGLIDQIRYVAYVHGMAGNKADRWELSHLEPPRITACTGIKIWLVCTTCFLIRFL